MCIMTTFIFDSLPSYTSTIHVMTTNCVLLLTPFCLFGLSALIGVVITEKKSMDKDGFIYIV